VETIIKWCFDIVIIPLSPYWIYVHTIVWLLAENILNINVHDTKLIVIFVHSTLNVHNLKMACPKPIFFMKSEKLYCN